jgi:hypothetical protein
MHPIDSHVKWIAGDTLSRDVVVMSFDERGINP